MAEFIWKDAEQLCRQLYSEGWRTPDTYTSGEFAEPADIPAVYLFLIYDQKSYFRKAIIGYVGQSIQVQTRWSHHEILIEINNSDGLWAMRWFLPTPSDELRAKERRLIQRFNPPWNINGRLRGIAHG